MRDDSQMPNFQGMSKPATDFEMVRDGRRSELFYVDIDLSAARTSAVPIFDGANQNSWNISGNSFYVDQDTANVGSAIVHFQDTAFAGGAPVLVGPGFIAKVPFTQIRIENAAQVGKRLRIFYGVDIDFVPGVNATISINSAVPVRATATNGGASLNVTNASTQVVAQNLARNFLMIQNNDASQSIYLRFGGAVTAANGLKLGPNGGVILMDSNVLTDAVYAIASGAGTTNVVCIES